MRKIFKKTSARPLLDFGKQPMHERNSFEDNILSKNL